MKPLKLLQFDVVTCALSGDYGKPRPCLILQRSEFNKEHTSLVVCPITSHVEKAIIFRPTLIPDEENGLEKLSQVMVDKITTIKKEKVGRVLGRIPPDIQEKVISALKLWLDII